MAITPATIDLERYCTGCDSDEYTDNFERHASMRWCSLCWDSQKPIGSRLRRLLEHLGERLDGAYDTLWSRDALAAGVMLKPDDSEVYLVIHQGDWNAGVTEHTTRGDAEVAAKLEDKIGSEALGALDTLKELAEWLRGSEKA